MARGGSGGGGLQVGLISASGLGVASRGHCMPHASSRLDLLLAPRDPERVFGAAEASWWSDAVRDGWWTAEGGLGPNRDAVVPGGFVRARLERDDRGRLVANQQGGVAARCRSCGTGLARGLEAAVREWQAGGLRDVACPRCGRVDRAEDLDLRPPAALARVWVGLADVAEGRISERAAATLTDLWGGFVVVPRRVG